MSLEDLQEAGVLLPEEEWGERALDSTMSRVGILATGAVAGLATVGMYLGGGGGWTWISAGIFLVDLFGFTALAWRAVNVQNRRRAETPSPKRKGEPG